MAPPRLPFFVSLLALLTVVTIVPAADANSVCRASSDKSFTLHELAAIIRNKTCQIKSIDDVLSILPDRMRSKMALFYRSQSLQGPHKIDYLHPRAILSSVPEFPDLNLPPAMMLSFNGHPSQSGYDRLEILDLKPSTQSTAIFNYHEIEFPDASQTDRLSWEEAQSSIKISKANPQQCVQCHGQPSARPVFQSYPTWEGAFGSRHTSTDSNEMNELQRFVDFQSQNPHSRYRHLNLARISPTDGYHPSPGINDPLHFGSAAQTIRINTDLANYNGMRVANIIRSLPFYGAFRFAIIGAMNRCEPSYDFFPKTVLEGLKSNIESINEFAAVTQSDRQARLFSQLLSTPHSFGSLGSFGEQHANLRSKIEYHRRYWNNDPVLFALSVDTISKQGPDRFVPETATLRLIFEGQGVTMSNWWSDLRQPTYRSNSGFGINWSEFLLANETSLKKQPPYPNDKDRTEFCKDLADLSRRSLRDYRVTPVFKPNVLINSSEYPAVFQNTCAKCHIEQDIGPRIPFHDPDQFANWAKVNNRLNKIEHRVFSAPEGLSMPPTRTLTTPELTEIRTYLERLR